MTVKELRDLLYQCEDDAIVHIATFPNGLEDAEELTKIVGIKTYGKDSCYEKVIFTSEE